MASDFLRGRRPEVLRPDPQQGWSHDILELSGAVAVPPVQSTMVQEAGLFYADGQYCPEGAIWRKHRPITIAPPFPKGELPIIPGRWLWGGLLFFHFGHFLMESTGRLWAIDQIEGPVDGILYLPKRPSKGAAVKGFHQDYINLMGRDLPIRVATEPSRIEALIVAGQGFGLGEIVRGTAPYRRAIALHFGADVAASGSDRLYISRSRIGYRKGALIGEKRLEEYLSAEGYEIFFPELHDLRTQIARYKSAKQVIAAEGSAIHLFAMVARAHQKIAVVLRRRSAASRQIEEHLRGFGGIEPLSVDRLLRSWTRGGEKYRRKHMALGEIDMPGLQTALATAGFVAADRPAWRSLDADEVQKMLGDEFHINAQYPASADLA